MNEPFATAEIDNFRADTAGCAQDRIFFNNAGAALQPRPVVERVVEHLRLEEEVGGYEAADRTTEEREAVYAAIARLIGADADEIALTESATRAWDMAFYSLAFQPGDRIVTAQNEYSSSCIAHLQIAKRTGAKIAVVPANVDGEIDLEALERILAQGRVRIVTLAHIATNNGMTQPAAEVGKLTRRYGALFLLDACQSVGQMQVDVKAIGCDMLSATGRKFLRGPRGTGFLYVRREILPQMEPPLLDERAAEWRAASEYVLRGDAKRFEGWESSAALRLGLGKAVNYALHIGLERIEERVQGLAAMLREELRKIDGVTVTDTGRVQSGIVMFIHDRVPSSPLVRQLAERQITARVSPRFATRLDERLSALDELVRASVHYFNTEEEVERFCAMVAELVR